MEIYKQIKDFYTVEKFEYSFFAKKNVTRKHKLYDGGKLLCTARYICPYVENDFKRFNNIKGLYQLMGEYRETQKNILNVIAERHYNNYNCGLIHLKTGGGKTIIMMGIICFLKAPTLILVNSVKMLEETVIKFKEFLGIDISPYYSKKKELGDIMITTHKTFSLSKGVLEGCNAEVILYDECHLSISKPMIKALCNTKAKALYGFTGTPYTKDYSTEDLELIFGKVIKTEKDNYFYIPEFKIINYKTNYRYLSDVHYADLRTAILENPGRQKIQGEQINQILKEREGVILILSERIGEVEIYEKMLKGRNVVKIVGGIKNADDLLKEGLDKNLKAEQLIIIGTIQVLGVGFDCPEIATVLLFCPIKIKQSNIQAIGRATRASKNKSDVKVFIWQDECLKSQKRQKIKAIKEEYGNGVEIDEIFINDNIGEKGKIAFEI